MATDPRRDYLTRCAVESLGASTGRWVAPAAELTAKLHADPALQEFLEQPSVRTLQVSVVPSGGSSDLECSNTVGFARPGGGNATGGVVFTKRSADMLTADNMATSVVMTTLVQSPLQTLQLNIKELYAPMLIKDKQVFNQLDPQTRATLEALDSALEAAVQLGMKKEHGHDEDDFANILTPHDECQHWKLIDGGMMPAASSDQRGRARQYWDILRPLADQIAMLHELPMPTMSKLLADLQGALDALFQAGYKESRMLHLIRVIGSALDGYLKRKLGECARARPFFSPSFRTRARGAILSPVTHGVWSVASLVSSAACNPHVVPPPLRPLPLPQARWTSGTTPIAR